MHGTTCQEGADREGSLPATFNDHGSDVVGEEGFGVGPVAAVFIVTGVRGRGVFKSAVTSVTAALAEDSSTMLRWVA